MLPSNLGNSTSFRGTLTHLVNNSTKIRTSLRRSCLPSSSRRLRNYLHQPDQTRSTTRIHRTSSIKDQPCANPPPAAPAVSSPSTITLPSSCPFTIRLAYHPWSRHMHTLPPHKPHLTPSLPSSQQKAQPGTAVAPTSPQSSTPCLRASAATADRRSRGTARCTRLEVSFSSCQSTSIFPFRKFWARIFKIHTAVACFSFCSGRSLIADTRILSTQELSVE